MDSGVITSPTSTAAPLHSDDDVLEQAIALFTDIMVRASEVGDKERARSAMEMQRRLISHRTPAQVARMERRWALR